ncbi:MAG TPA: hypothetical protein PLK36_06520 [Methanoregulaceae archaeon]|nr:hypothetical protein [Methanoregulaceae archaeon]HQP82631.1 hypothetical protein [Methanoregulaceae archaeon]
MLQERDSGIGHPGYCGTDQVCIIVKDFGNIGKGIRNPCWSGSDRITA